MEQPNRNYTDGTYRYGFSGMEKDDELKGKGNSIDFGARMYDPRVGRWFSPDAMESDFPHHSPYLYASNSPLVLIDPDGNTDITIHLVRVFKNGTTTISVMKVQAEGMETQYFALVARTNMLTSDGKHIGYLVRKSLGKKYKGQKKGDSPEITKRMQEVASNIKQGDDRLPKEFQKGIQTPMGHNGIRIYQESISAKKLKNGRVILKGGNVTLHPGNSIVNVGGCEAVGNYCGASTAYTFGVGDSQGAMYDFLTKILNVYDNDILNNEATRINFIIDTNLNKSNEIEEKNKGFYPKDMYLSLFPPKKKVSPLNIPMKGVKINFKNTNSGEVINSRR